MTITVSVTTDYTGQTFVNESDISFTAVDSATATFTADQFGPGLILDTVAITGNAQINEIVVNMTAAGTFTAAGWTFNSWTASNDQLTFNGTADADSITGSSQNDTLYGGNGNGNDTLNGGDGNDSLVGGDGNSSLIGGAGNDTLVGRIGTDSLVGGDGNDTLDGGGGGDSMTGGAGDDLYVRDNAADIVVELANEGTDTVQTALASYTLAANVENLTGIGTAQNLTGNALGNAIQGTTGSDTLFGLDGSDSLVGGNANDTLDGGAGNDTMMGGAGDDTYVLESSADVVTELANEGTDTVQTDLPNYTLAANLENLTLTGALGRVANGNSLDNVIIGTTGNDTLFGLDGNDSLVGGNGNDSLTGGTGNDTLNGGAGNDTMTGGTGDDSYILDGADVIIEAANEGIDTIFTSALPGIGSTTPVSAAWFNLGNYANIENVTGTAATGQWLAGNSLSNVVTGGIGGDYLFGGAGGIDTLVGGLGDDWYYVNSENVDVIVEDVNGGLDYVYIEVANIRNYTLADNVEVFWANQASLGPQYSGTYTGNALNNRFVSNSQSSDTLNGLDGNDWIDGGDGNDRLNGGQGADSMTGGNGNDTLDGGTENDTLGGGAGNDLYLAVEAGDIVYELANEGTDTIQTAIATYALSSELTFGNFENLTGTSATAQSLTGNHLNNNITGGIGNDTLIGLGGTDTLNGGAGDDSMAGGASDDTYFVDSVGDIVLELVDEGTDTIRSTLANQSLVGTEVENLIGIAATAQTLTGNALSNIITGGVSDDTLIGGEGDDTLDGGAGNDSITGGGGNDFYFVDSTNDTVVEIANEGTDTVRTTLAAYSLAGTEIENLLGAATSGQLLTGNIFANQLLGNIGNDTLDGGAGNDTLTGGLGNDTYHVDTALNVVTEGANEGTDTIRTSQATYTLGNNVENLIGTSTTAQTLTGNTLNNAITGGIGNDTLDGLAGNDTLTGGLGNDTYIVDSSADVIVELGSEGTLDTVRTSVAAYTLTSANIEFLTGTLNTGQTLTGLAAGRTVITGGSGNDSLNGGSEADTLIGGEGNNVLTGGLGNDIYFIGSLTDTIVEAVNGGIADRVQTTLATYTLAENVEDVTGTAGGNQMLTGNGLDNAITGTAVTGTTGLYQGLGGNDLLYGAGGNETLDGGTGNDTMTGGLGDDTYVVDSTLDVIVEFADQGTDTVQVTSATYTLALPNIENLTGIAATAQTLTGNNDANKITGGIADDTLNGSGGNDTLDGGTGADALFGGAGDDTYLNFVFGTDTMNELDGEGTDTIITGAFSAVLFGFGGYIENVTFTGGGAHYLVGNVLDNVFTGNTGTDSLFGSDGNDTLFGLGGNDTLNGGSGTDSLVGSTGDDRYQVDTILDVVVELANEGSDTITTTLATYTLGDNIERLEGGGLAMDVSRTYTGNGLDNVLTGASLDDLLTGGGGNDILSSLGGNDTLDGGIGNDSMLGFTGDDTYIFDSVDDYAQEDANEGTDTIQTALATYTLTAANIENLTGTATTGQALTGSVGSNVITGSIGKDSLNGGGGTDTLAGGGDDDLYTIVSGLETVTELAPGGTDTVQTALATYTLNAANIEILNGLTGIAQALTGSSGANTINAGIRNDTLDGGAGDDIINANSGNDIINGGDGNDVIDGGLGRDAMSGGLNNDRFLVNDTGDRVFEDVGGGTDTVVTSLDYALLSTAEIERFEAAAGTDPITLLANNFSQAVIGNDGINVLKGFLGNDTIEGQGGNDQLWGGRGNDTLTGGTGLDSFVFEQALSGTSNFDVITDFNIADDRFLLDDAIFSGFAGALGTIAANRFVVGSNATTVDHRIIYEQATGKVFYDADGSGTGVKIFFAEVTDGLALTRADFVLF